MYLPHNAAEQAERALLHASADQAVNAPTRSRNRKRKARDPDEVRTIDPHVACVILAECKVDELNSIYDNPETDTPCTCRSCTMRTLMARLTPCNCTGCSPEVQGEEQLEHQSGRAGTPAVESEEEPGDDSGTETEEHAGD